MVYHMLCACNNFTVYPVVRNWDSIFDLKLKMYGVQEVLGEYTALL